MAGYFHFKPSSRLCGAFPERLSRALMFSVHRL